MNLKEKMNPTTLGVILFDTLVFGIFVYLAISTNERIFVVLSIIVLFFSIAYLIRPVSVFVDLKKIFSNHE